jgi:hypothetical protein
LARVAGQVLASDRDSAIKTLGQAARCGSTLWDPPPQVRKGGAAMLPKNFALLG